MMSDDVVKICADGAQLTRLGMGCWAAGGHGWGVVNDNDSIAAIRHAYERGITFFDTADCYGLGKSESILRQALGANLKSLFIASKGGVRWDNAGKVWNDSSPSYLRQAAEASLKRLGVERIPLYYLHKHDNKTPIAETMGALLRLREEGKIGEIGVANFSANQLTEALEVAPVKAVQVQYNLLYRNRGIELADICQRYGVLLVAWGALADGLLTGKYGRESVFDVNDHRNKLSSFIGDEFIKNLQCVENLKLIAQQRGVFLSQLALRWVMESYEWACPLFGAKTPIQVEQNWGASGWKLTHVEMKLIDECSVLLR